MVDCMSIYLFRCTVFFYGEMVYIYDFKLLKGGNKAAVRNTR